MSNHYLESRAALLAAISHLTPVSTDATLTDKADKYYRFIYLPSGDTPATLGDGGQDEYAGFAQIDVCSKVAKGFKTHSDMIHAARSAYSYSKPLTYGQTTVMVSSVTASPVPVDNDLYSRTALTIYFKYRVQRG